MTLTGANFIDGSRSALGEGAIRASDRQSFQTLELEFSVASKEEVAAAASAAANAFQPYARLDPSRRAEFLEAIAVNIEDLGDELLDRASRETALPTGRLIGERARTCGQLRMFAALIREGSWVEARIDRADPARASGPKPDLRRMLVPLGPVAVFGASNFPFAFSVAGGDSSSALAAGCPIVVKAHPSHPGTSELTAQAVMRAVEALGMPTGVFNMVFGGADVGRALVQNEHIEAVGFTGSKLAGRALYDLAASRPRPIPVFAEMGSVNPIFVLPGALRERSSELAAAYAASLSGGVGQFCTNPGVIVGLSGSGFEEFLSMSRDLLAKVPPGTMLNDAIAKSYAAGLEVWSKDKRLTAIQEMRKAPSNTAEASPALYSVSAKDFLADPELAEEHFGPAGLAVVCSDLSEMHRVAKSLVGQLTATVQYADSEISDARDLLPLLVQVAGRVIANGVPTGVEVCPSMQHGGPYPASTDSRTTSVGTAAISRFARPVAFQNVPNDLLPKALQDGNPLGIMRLVDGAWSLTA